MRCLCLVRNSLLLTGTSQLGHHNVINYCNRQFSNVEDMNEAIVKICNDTVKEDDELYILGDVALNPKYVEIYLPQLKCRNLFLVCGNHDQCFDKGSGKKLEKLARAKEKYLTSGFKTITNDLFIKVGEHEVHLCHFPFEGNTTDQRYKYFRPENVGQILLHGHSHCYYRKLGNAIDCGIDGNWKIWSEKEIIELIEDPRDYIPSPITEYYKNRKNNNE